MIDDRQLAEALEHVEPPVSVLDLVVGRVAGARDHRRQVLADLVARVAADRQVDLAVVGQLGDPAARAGEVGVQGVVSGADIVERQVLELRGRDRTGGGEEVERNARDRLEVARHLLVGHVQLVDDLGRGVARDPDADRRAAGVEHARAERVGDVQLVELTGGPDPRLADPVVVGHLVLPVLEHPPRLGDAAGDAQDEPAGRDLVDVVARAELGEPPPVIEDVAAQRVVDAELADRGFGIEPDRRQLAIAGAVHVRGLEQHRGVFVDPVTGGRERAVAGRRRVQVILRRVVVEVARRDEVGPAAVAVGLARARGAPGRDHAAGADRRRVEPAAGRRQRLVARHRLAREVVAVLELREPAIAGEHRRVVLVAGREHEIAVPVLRREAADDAGVVLDTVAVLRGAGQQRDVGAVELRAGDDVDHAPDGVGAVQHRRAVLQDLDALDHGERDGRDVGRRVGARAAVDHAAAVDQDEGARRAQAAQVDPRRAVAAGVDLGVGAVGLGGQRLQDVAEGRAARRGEIGAGHDRDRRPAGEQLALDRRVGHRDHLGLAVVRGRRGALLAGRTGRWARGRGRRRRCGRRRGRRGRRIAGRGTGCIRGRRGGRIAGRGTGCIRGRRVRGRVRGRRVRRRVRGRRVRRRRVRWSLRDAAAERDRGERGARRRLAHAQRARRVVVGGGRDGDHREAQDRNALRHAHALRGGHHVRVVDRGERRHLASTVRTAGTSGGRPCGRRSRRWWRRSWRRERCRPPAGWRRTRC